MTNLTVIEISKLICKYGEREIFRFKDENPITIKTGQITFVLGDSGSGKTSFLQAIGLMKRNYEGLIRLNSGVVNFSSESLDYTSEIWTNSNLLNKIRRDHLSFIFQENYLISKFNVQENLELPLFLRTSNPELSHYTAHEKRRKELLDVLFVDSDCGFKYNYESLLRSNIYDLSVGQRQRVSLASGLLKNPTILFADEPTGNLDEKNAKLLIEMIDSDIGDKKSKLQSAIVITHDKKLLEHVDQCSVLRISCHDHHYVIEEI